MVRPPGIASLRLVGEPATAQERLAAFGVAELPATEVTEVADEAVSRCNEPDVRAVGVPGGGGFGRTVSPARRGRAGWWRLRPRRHRWSDRVGRPGDGLSSAFVTNGDDRHEVRQPRRTTSLGSRAVTAVTSGAT